MRGGRGTRSSEHLIVRLPIARSQGRGQRRRAGRSNRLTRARPTATIPTHAPIRWSTDDARPTTRPAGLPRHDRLLRLLGRQRRGRQVRHPRLAAVRGRGVPVHPEPARARGCLPSRRQSAPDQSAALEAAARARAHLRRADRHVQLGREPQRGRAVVDLHQRPPAHRRTVGLVHLGRKAWLAMPRGVGLCGDRRGLGFIFFIRGGATATSVATSSSWPRARSSPCKPSGKSSRSRGLRPQPSC